MLASPSDFKTLLEGLNCHQVRYVIIGGLAMIAHGSAHVTDDIDIFYSRDKQNCAAIAVALAPFSPKLRGVPEGLPFILDSKTFRNIINLTLSTSIGSLDLLGEAPGVKSYDDLATRAIAFNLMGVETPVASLDDLIDMKRATGRPKDQNHLMELLALQVAIFGQPSNVE